MPRHWIYSTLLLIGGALSPMSRTSGWSFRLSVVALMIIVLQHAMVSTLPIIFVIDSVVLTSRWTHSASVMLSTDCVWPSCSWGVVHTTRSARMVDWTYVGCVGEHCAHANTDSGVMKCSQSENSTTNHAVRMAFLIVLSISHLHLNIQTAGDGAIGAAMLRVRTIIS